MTKKLPKVKGIIRLEKDPRGIPYTDNFCFFRCVALHKGYNTVNLEPKTRELADVWGKPMVTLSDLEAGSKGQNVTFYVSNVYKSQPKNIFNSFFVLHVAVMHFNGHAKAFYSW